MTTRKKVWEGKTFDTIYPGNGLNADIGYYFHGVLYGCKIRNKCLEFRYISTSGDLILAPSKKEIEDIIVKDMVTNLIPLLLNNHRL